MAISLKYNNIPSASATSFVTFTDIPNIVTVENDASGYQLAELVLSVGDGWSTATHTDPWYITINGETITAVDDFSNAINKNFCIFLSTTSTAASMAKALRNCPSLAASFYISNAMNQVTLKARGKGAFTWNLQTNATSYVTTASTAGTVADSIIGGTVDVNIKDGDNNYITTLSKSYYESGMGVDVTPVLTTLAMRGKTVPYKLEVAYTADNGGYSSLGSITGNSITQGYLVNQGFRYLPLNTLTNNFIVAQNFSRGEDKSWTNNSMLYVYGNDIPLSWYSKTLSSITVDVNYLSSAYAVVHTETKTLTDNSNGWLHNSTVQLNQSYKSEAYFIVLALKDGNTALTSIGYNVIKPLKATEYYQRIYWRNSYGGVSFFDFTATKTETRDVDITTYQKNIYDFYTEDRNELDMIYDNKVKYSVTLKSHLIEKDGTYIFNDLLQSPEVWVEVNGEQYGIILDSVSVDEDNRNNLYTATIKYHYSQEPSLI